MKLSEKQTNNLMIFLDRVEYKGMQEVQAIQEIVNILLTSSEAEQSNIENQE